MAKQFEDLYCWQISHELVNLIYQITSSPNFKDFSLKDQIRRAVVSVLSNIAEGFERGTRDEFLYFLYIAKGSCGEVRSQLYIALDQKFVTQDEFNNAYEKSKQVSAVLYKFIEGFKSKGYTGLRHKPSTIISDSEQFLKEIREKYLEKK